MKKNLLILGGLAAFLSLAVAFWGRPISNDSGDHAIKPMGSKDSTESRSASAVNVDADSSNKNPAAQSAIAAYKPTPGVAGRNLLDEMYAKGVPINHDSIVAARGILKQGISDDEKVALARILGSLYSPNNSSEENEGILSDLRQLSGSGSKEVARMAVITYSRLGYLSDTENMLAFAYQAGSMSANDYFGELAHLVEVAPQNAKGRIAKNISDSANPYAADILAMSISGDPKILGDYSDGAASDIAQILLKNEPAFPSGLGEFGLGVAMQYSSWLRAGAELESKRSGKNVDALIIENLGRSDTDPRKVMAYLLTPESASILKDAPLGSPAGGLVAITNRYANQFPSNPMLREYAQDIARRANQNR